MMGNKNPEEFYQSMLQTNPQFKEFVTKNEGKSLEDIALEYDLDFNLIKQFM